MSLTALANTSLSKGEKSKICPLCINCGKLADEEAIKYRKVRAIGFQYIFQRTTRNHQSVLAYVMAKSVFGCWWMYTILSKNTERLAKRVQIMKRGIGLKDMFDYWRRRTQLRKTQGLKDKIYSMQLDPKILH